MMKRFFCLLLIAVGMNGAVMAQNLTVRGIVRDGGNKEALPFVNVALCRPADTLFVRGGTSDAEGKFVVKDVTAGDYLLHISMVGYQEVLRPVKVEGAMDLGVIELREGTVLKEVQVVTSRPLFSMDGEKNIYNTMDDPTIQTGSASDALQNAPGIEIDADGNITLRGTQSVEVWINDRPSHMDGEALKQYIKMLPANSIEKIEVISNPSARYGGGTPVVNIVTNQKISRNEFVSVGLNGSSRPDQGILLSEMKPWASYVYANEKFNFNIYANFGYNNRESEFTGVKEMRDADGVLRRDVDYLSQSHTKSMGGYLGGHLSYSLSDRDEIGGWYGCYPSWESVHEYGESIRWDYPVDGSAPLDYSYTGTEDSKNGSWPEGGGYFGGYYQHKFDTSTGEKLNVNVNGNGYNSRYYTHHERHYTVHPERDIVSDVDSRWGSLSGSMDVVYVLPFGEKDTSNGLLPNELDYGVEYFHTNSRSWDIRSWQQMGPFVGVTDSLNTDKANRSDQMGFYATYQRRFGDLAVKLGLRGNVDHSVLDYYNRPQYSADTTFFKFTPSVHLSYSTKSMHNLSLSYTRRVTQPGLSELTLYKQYDLDDYGSWGNPDLLPMYNQNIEFQWDKYFTKFGSVGAELYFSKNTNESSELADVVYSDFYGNWVSYTMPMNIGDSWNTGLDLHVTYRPTAFINIRFNGGVLYNNEDFTFRDVRFENHKWSYKFRVNAWAKLWKNYQFFVNAHYGSPMQSIFTITDARKGVDVGVNADFFEKKMTVNFNVHDVFNTNAWNSSNVNPFYSSTSVWKPMSRFITLGVTVRFGKMELAGMANEGQASSAGGMGE